MNDQEIVDVKLVGEAKQSPQMNGPGRRLKQARELADLTQEDIAMQLHLRVQVVVDLEHDNFSAFKSHVFVRGYLRSYARLLGLPADEIVQSFNQLGIPEEIIPSVPRGNYEQLSNHRNWLSELQTWLPYLLVLLIIVAGLSWWHKESVKEREQEAAKAAQLIPKVPPAPVPQIAKVQMPLVAPMSTTPAFTVSTIPPLNPDRALANSAQAPAPLNNMSEIPGTLGPVAPVVTIPVPAKAASPRVPKIAHPKVPVTIIHNQNANE